MKKPHQIRIIGGKWRRRSLPVNSDPALRPTPDRQRETLFNWLQPTIDNTICLDLYAGTGVLGFEALSRGAGHVTFVDHSFHNCQAIRHMAQNLECETVTVHKENAHEFLAQCQQPFDLIFLDPPFDSSLLQQNIDALAIGPLCHPGCQLYLEYSSSGSAPKLPQHWSGIKHCRTGSVFGDLVIVT